MWWRDRDDSPARQNIAFFNNDIKIALKITATHLKNTAMVLYMAVYTTRDVVWTPGILHPGDETLYTPNKPPDLSPGFVVYYTPRGALPHARQSL